MQSSFSFNFCTWNPKLAFWRFKIFINVKFCDIGKNMVLIETLADWIALSDLTWFRLFSLLLNSVLDFTISEYWITDISGCKLTHLFPMHPFSTSWKHQKTVGLPDAFKG